MNFHSKYVLIEDEEGNRSTQEIDCLLGSEAINNEEHEVPAVQSLDADVSDSEIQKITEDIFATDNSNLQKEIKIDYQGKPKLLQVNQAALGTATIKKLYPLLDNYILDSTQTETITPKIKQQENEFLDAIMSTSVMKIAMTFLEKKGIVKQAAQRELLQTIWFARYARSGAGTGSSGFEHVFVAERTGNKVLGLHNWIYYHKEEQKGNVKYKGFQSKLELGNKGMVIKFSLEHNGKNKPVNSMFVGTSPEVEMAVYTICFMLRANRDCRVSMGGSVLNIRTYFFNYKGQNLIGSAYPQI